MVIMCALGHIHLTVQRCKRSCCIYNIIYI